PRPVPPRASVVTAPHLHLPCTDSLGRPDFLAQPRLDGIGPPRLSSMELGQLGPTLSDGRLIRDRIPAVDALRLVADHRHSGGARDPCPFQVANRRAAGVVRNPTDESRLPASPQPPAA